MSAKRSARTCSAASPTCCSRPRAIPAMLIYLDNAQSIGPDSVAGINNDARAQREPGARNPRTAYARRAHRLRPGRRHQLRQGADRLDHPADRTTIPDHGGEFVFNKRMHEPGAADRDRQDLSGHRHRAGPRGAGRSRAPSGDRAAHRDQACAPFHRRRSAAGAGRAADAALPRDRRRPQGGHQGAGHLAGGLGPGAGQDQAAGRMDHRDAARDRHRRR